MAKKPKQGNTPSMSNEAPVVAEKAKKSLPEQIAELELRLQKMRDKLAGEQQINNVQVGDDVSFKFGRADKIVILTGTVSAVADTPLGRRVAVTTGEGFDLSIKRIRAHDITENRTANARNASDPATPSEDPLASE